MSAKRLRITGFVQGVMFRASAKDHAEDIGVTGWVKNLYDGSLDLHVEGDDALVEKYVDWCREGPPAARVSGVEIDDVNVVGYESFEIDHET